MLLATVVASAEAKEGVDFLPLTVDYQEKFAAAGKIPGGFLKRESRLSNYEILISRLPFSMHFVSILRDAKPFV